MQHRARRQMAPTYYSAYSLQITSLLPESPLHQVPEIEVSGLEWFDTWLYEMRRKVGYRDQNVPDLSFSDTGENMLDSQEADFTVPSTPVDHKLQDVVSAIDQTLVWNPLPQDLKFRQDCISVIVDQVTDDYPDEEAGRAVPQVKLDPQATASKESATEQP